MSAGPLPDFSHGLLIGKYRVERVIGEGAMGVVVEATNVDLDQRVALKFMRDPVSAGDAAADRFAREARAAARLKSEHVARVFDVSSYNGAPFIVMELLEGQDLEALLATRGPLPIDSAALFVIQACEALAEAHSRGIVHRDVKPANVFVVEPRGLAPQPDRFRTAKLLDFGISKIAAGSAAGRSLRDTTGLVGSPCYMAPEQFRGAREARPTCDVWGLGLVLFEALTGRGPFEASERAGDLAALMHAVTTKPHPRVRSLRPDVPEALERIVDWCLEKDPAQRCPSAADLAWALLPFAPDAARRPAEHALAMAGKVGRASEPPSAPPPPVIVEAMSAAPIQAASSPSLGRGMTRVALAVIGVTCLGLWFERGRRADIFRTTPVVAAEPRENEVTIAAAAPPPAETTSKLEAADPIAALPPAAVTIVQEADRAPGKRSARRNEPARRAGRASAASPSTDGPGVDTKAINAAVRAHAGEVQACIDKARARAGVDAVRGRLAVNISLDAGGAITGTSVSSSTVGSRDLETCVLAVVHSWKLPPPSSKAKSQVTYSFVFR